MFLPRLTDEGRQLIYDYNDNFVRGQFLHYGVDWDEEELVGCGVALLQQKLKAGELDRVPEHTQDLKTKMHQDWLHRLTVEDLAQFPDFVLPKYFLDAHGRPSSATMKVLNLKVVNIRFAFKESRDINKLRESAKKIGLYELVTAYDRVTKTLHLGWSQEDVHNALGISNEGDDDEDSDNDVPRPTAAAKASKSQGSKTKSVTSKASSATGKNGNTECSPVGKYEITCEEVENQWPDAAMGMSMKISACKEAPGIFEAVFQFGVYEGMMVIGSNETDLYKYCKDLDRKAKAYESDSDSSNVSSDDGSIQDDNEDENEDEEEGFRPSVGSGSKRGAPAKRGRPPKKVAIATTENQRRPRGRPPKKAAIEGTESQRRPRGRPPKNANAAKRTTKPVNYFIRLRCRETDSHIYPGVLKGTLTFKGTSFESFTLVVTDSFHAIGNKGVFKGSRFEVAPRSLICDDVDGKWEDYFERRYEAERRGRWGGG
ncbi:hypothetical protein V8F20_012148 [Naviculisporaceae sp. PSN 640]